MILKTLNVNHTLAACSVDTALRKKNAEIGEKNHHGNVSADTGDSNKIKTM